jgi:hypothetical protein
MDRLELTAYPMPPGTPRLMPFHDMPFNGDGYAAAEVLRLRDKHSIRSVVETGTCLGSTAIWLAENFDVVNTAEVNYDLWKIAILRAEGVLGAERQGVKFYPCDSVEMLKQVSGELYWLDAHWNQHCPLLDELSSIAAAKVRPVIMIHDFQVPGRPDLGHDIFPDRTPFHLPAIAEYLDAIYGIGGWDHHYNDKAEGAKRGIIYIEPK